MKEKFATGARTCPLRISPPSSSRLTDSLRSRQNCRQAPRFVRGPQIGATMNDIPEHEATQSAAHSGLRTGWLPDAEMAKERGKSTRAQRDERQKGIGPPWTRDGRDVLYNVEGYREWLTANARNPVREPQPKQADRKGSPALKRRVTPAATRRRVLADAEA